MSIPGEVLVVCTGNICRSPYVERRLAELTGLGDVVASAGVHAVVGSAMSPGSIAQLVARGGTAEAFVARQLTIEMLDVAGLVLCATREHRREAVQLNPRALIKAFALADFADLVAQVPPGPVRPGPMDDAEDSPFTLLARAAARERGAVNARTEVDATIVDPIGQPDAVYARMAQQVEAVLPPVVEALGRVRRD